MDRNTFLQIKERLGKRTLYFGIGGVVAIGLVGFGVGAFSKGSASVPEQGVAEHKSEPKQVAVKKHSSHQSWFAQFKSFLDPTELVEIYGQAFVSVQHKVAALQKAEEENRRLKLENAHLRFKAEATQFACSSKKAEETTQNLQLRLSKETGSVVGRTLASISYSPPTDLTPSQLFTLGMSYFKMADHEKSAVIFSFLTGLADSDMFKTPENFMLTGISWYRLDNFELADHYFEQVIGFADADHTLKAKAQARLWKALTAAKLGKRTKAQYWLRDLMDHHPHSREAKWVNSREVNRAVATEE